MPLLLFSGYYANGNDGLWVSDGTASGIATISSIGAALRLEN